ncbi:MAG: hypothetical protein V3T88_09155 [Nitrosomonadaceae bacterium]
MTRTTGTHDEVAHAWANRHEGPHKGFNLFFEGDTIYSHGHHFPIARWTKDSGGRDCVLFTTQCCSVSTANHISKVSRALHGIAAVYRVYDVVTDTYDTNTGEYTIVSKVVHKKNYERIKASMEQCFILAARARRYAGIHLSGAETLRNEMNQYTKAFRLGYRQIPEPTDGAQADLIAKVRAKEKEAQRTKDAKAKADIRRWMAFEQDQAPHTTHPYVRINKATATIETSWGARVPLRQGLALYRLATRVMKHGINFTPDKIHHIGNYRLDSIDTDGVLCIGCHILPRRVQTMTLKAAGML